MNEIWVMSVTTSLPEVRFDADMMQNTICAFDSFSKAREALQKLLQGYAFSKNKMFDGNGNMTYMKRYLDEVEDFDDDEDDSGWISENLAAALQTTFRTLFSGKDACLDLIPGTYEDGMIRITVTPDSVAFQGVDDGPINGYNPMANTNMFSMQEDKDYYLYLNDAFGWVDDDASSELYIDLKKVTVQ